MKRTKITNHNSYNKCPKCGDKKDIRSKICIKCYCKIDHIHHLGKYAKNGAIPWNKGLNGIQSGSNSSRWKGGKTIGSHGYILIHQPNHHRTTKNGYVMEHILIWEKIYQRKLPNGYIIHHLNGIRNDNRPENLVAMKRGAHSQLAEPYKKRIRELELEIAKLKQFDLFKKEG